MTKAT
jgi:hypothetical protein